MAELLTKQEAIQKHRELWDKIVEILERGDDKIISHINVLKQEALIKLGYDPEEIYNYCWVCEYVKQNNRRASAYNDCICILNWGDNKGCESFGSCYNSFVRYLFKNDRVKAIEFAKQIRDLPEKENNNRCEKIFIKRWE